MFDLGVSAPFASSAVKKILPFPIPAMTCDVGNHGDHGDSL
jgi:hypothetical protein